MNNNYILFHLREAQEELTRTINALENNTEYDEAAFEGAITHLYNHVNTAWNARNTSSKEIEAFSDELFYQWRTFPNDIDMA